MTTPRSSATHLTLVDGSRRTRPSLERIASPARSLADRTLPDETTGLWRRPELPRPFGAYVLEERLGAGGMGAVYRATRADGGPPVAVKVLSEHLVGGEGAERFRREIGALAELAHPSIVRLLDHGWVEDQPFYVMELVDGPDLARLVAREGPQPPARVAAIVRDLAEGLAHAHGRGFVHRDIKPSNVILAREPGGERAKLLDFGLVLSARGLGERLTAEDMLLGTPGYMAPEGTKSAHAVGPRADLYALAMIAFFLRTGRHLFRPAEVVCEEAHAAALARGRDLLRDAGGLPGALEAHVLSLLAFDARERPSSAQALADSIAADPEIAPWTARDADAWRAHLAPPARESRPPHAHAERSPSRAQ
ncbi:MAG: serine/threonine protein kinase [Sandaracinaceae bacterium]|nr:serine/threonine protein kinase [Sandaracinaceae bacterium]